MRHHVKGKTLNRNTNQRKALFKSLISSLVTHGEIKTTLTKAKVIQGMTDKMITTAKSGNLASRRQLQAFFNHHRLTNRVVDYLAPQMKARNSGYTRITKLGRRRGDNTMMAKISFSDTLTPPETVTPAPSSASKTTPKTPSRAATLKTTTKTAAKTKTKKSA